MNERVNKCHCLSLQRNHVFNFHELLTTCTVGIFGEEETIFIPISFVLKIQIQQQLVRYFAFLLWSFAKL